MNRTALAILVLLVLTPSAPAQKQFGFDNKKPSGQLYLDVAESLKRMKVADGFTVSAFAAEPMVVNPIAFTMDERGRLWVVECFEYPRRTPEGKMPRDRIVILEDTDGDGAADRRTVFAEGKDFPFRFDLATGIEVGRGGVFLGAAPYLWFIENKDDKPGKFEVLLKGFGSQDTHETLNTFQWGPDGWLYGLHGIFTNSEVNGQKINGGVWRYDPRSRKFEVYAEGTSNPWGWDYRNTDGQMILACCVIPHLFHITPGGIYKRQAGQSFNPYAFGYMNEICDHTLHSESGWAHAGLLSLDTPIMPKEYQDSVIFGSIHGCSIKRNVLKRTGSTFTASKAPDFLTSGDKNFRPINMRWGPNGEIYLIDWHDKNPCHQASPESWDYEHGRIYRIHKTGTISKKADDLGRVADEGFGKKGYQNPDWGVYHDNPWKARTALRLIHERGDKAVSDPLERFVQKNLVNKGAHLESLWIANAYDRELHNNMHYTQGWLAYFGLQAEPTAEGPISRFRAASFAGIRPSAIRILGEHPSFSAESLKLFVKIAEQAMDAPTRIQLASSAQRIGRDFDTATLLHALMRHKEDATDPAIPLMLWYAYEPRLAAKAKEELDWLQANAAGNPLITDHILPKAIRRLAMSDNPEHLALAVGFAVNARNEYRIKALEGLAAALENRQVKPPREWMELQQALGPIQDESTKKLMRILAVSFRDPAIVAKALAAARDAKLESVERAEAVRELALLKPPEARTLFLSLLAPPNDAAVRREAIRGLAEFDDPKIAAAVLAQWPTLTAPLRAEATNLLAGRKVWAKALVKEVEVGRVPATDLNTNVVLRMRAFRDQELDKAVTRHWGPIRAETADMTALINQKRQELSAGPGSIIRGKKLFTEHCGKCHKFEGAGHDVGPALDGAGRDIEYLLVNILNPNQVVGAPYQLRRVMLTTGRIEEGMLAAEDANSITLKTENDQVKVFVKKDIDEVQVSEKSVMPEGLTKTLGPQDFRDLFRYLVAHPFISAWQMTGPIERTKLPMPDPAAILKENALSWRAVETPVTGRIPVPKVNIGEYLYLKAKLTANEALSTKLQLGAAAKLRVWLDGKLLFDGTPGSAPVQPDQAAVDVKLAKGEHELVVEFVARGGDDGLFVRLLDADRKIVFVGEE